MNKFLSAVIIVLLGLSWTPVHADQEKTLSLDYYLPQASGYSASIPTPSSSLGYEVGEWHVRPEQIAYYFENLASASDRVKIEVIGYSHEKRPLILAYISSPENLKNLEQHRASHIKNQRTSETPLFTWMGYSVHGNESSGSNAALLFAYHYAAANDKDTLAQLDKQVIIVDPMLNPDGLARFANWVNRYKSQSPNSDPADAEHNESWPSGRTNHYWFDLNRDWLLLQHPESRARVSQFHRWRPHILTDFHEMGTNSTYFFQPGVHSRQNPLTPKDNFKMTATIAEYHAKALDDIGSLYYSKESFDDFYYGKGSTYPDAHGTVGILFEQASARGHVQDSIYGKLSFPFSIRNHLTTSFSTIKAAQANFDALKNMRTKFISETQQLADKDKSRAVVVSSKDSYRVEQLLSILKQHKVDYFPLAKKLKLDSKTFSPSNSYLIPLKQPQYRLIKSMFETRKQFPDRVFYDVSSWNMGMAFDLDYAFVGRSKFSQSLLAESKHRSLTKAKISPQALAVAFDSKNMATAQLLVALHKQKVRVQVTTKPTQLPSSSQQALSLGSIIIPLKGQSLNRSELVPLLQKLALEFDLQPIEINGGLAISGVDMGSPSVPVLKPVKPALLIGKGVSSYQAGEVWHWLDEKLSQPVTLLDISRINRLSQGDYSHLIVVGGRYKFSEQNTKEIERWVKNGGIIIAHSTGAKWLTSQKWTSSQVKKFIKPVDTKANYADRGQINAEHVVGGAIADLVIDTSHPIGFGLDNESIPVFKRSEQVFTEPKEAFVGVARFTDKPHAAGYMSKEVVDHLKGQTSVFVQRLGKGKLIAFSDNPLFRGFWYGTGKLFNNALYYSQIIAAPTKSKPKESDKTTKK